MPPWARSNAPMEAFNQAMGANHNPVSSIDLIVYTFRFIIPLMIALFTVDPCGISVYL